MFFTDIGRLQINNTQFAIISYNIDYLNEFFTKHLDIGNNYIFCWTLPRAGLSCSCWVVPHTLEM